MWFVKFYVAYAFIFSDLNYKMVIFLSQTEVPLNIFLEKKALGNTYVFLRGYINIRLFELQMSSNRL
jgi:hypothetical protein